jgi:predicted glycogen debranching enzyme
MSDIHGLDDEWLEADGLGGFASGTVGGRRARRYHALLLTATTPPTGRITLVNGLEVWVESDGQTYPLSTHQYSPDVIHPDGQRRLEDFQLEPWPRWTFRLENGAVIEQELFVPHERAAVAIRWRLAQAPAETSEPIRLAIRPLLSGRDYHSLHHENPGFQFNAERDGQSIKWWPYDGIPGVAVLTNGAYEHAPEWYRNFLYCNEIDRGLDGTEDLASPGAFRWNLADADAVWIASATEVPGSLSEQGAADDVYGRLRLREQRRRTAFVTQLDRAADAYIVRRNAARTIVAGYPWFTDWGVIRSSRCEDWRSRRTGSTWLAKFCSPGRESFPKGCCPIVFPTVENHWSSTRSTRRCGTSLPRMSFFLPRICQAVRSDQTTNVGS